MLFATTSLIAEWYVKWYVTGCLSHCNCKSENLVLIDPEYLELAPGPRSEIRYLMATLQILSPYLNIYHPYLRSSIYPLMEKASDTEQFTLNVRSYPIISVRWIYPWKVVRALTWLFKTVIRFSEHQSAIMKSGTFYHEVRNTEGFHKLISRHQIDNQSN